MKLPSFKRLNTIDYENQFKKLVETLSVSLNIGIEALYEALNNEVTLKDNIACTVKNVTLRVDTNGKPLTTTSFVQDVEGKIYGIEVINAVNTTNTGVYPTGAPFVSWTQNNTIITITNVTGLQANNTYVLTLIAWNQ